MNKTNAFDYFVFRLIELAKTQKIEYTTELTKLKLLKLLFFTTAVTSSKHSKGLLEVFDDYWALPYGHVESGVYNYIPNSIFFKIDKSGVTTLNNNLTRESFGLLENEIYLIDKAIDSLLEKNPNILSYSAFQLVELSHEWQSWKSMFNLAKINRKSGLKIPIEMIQNEPKFYSLENE